MDREQNNPMDKSVIDPVEVEEEDPTQRIDPFTLQPVGIPPGYGREFHELPLQERKNLVAFQLAGRGSRGIYC